MRGITRNQQVENRETSHRSELVWQACKLQMAMQKHFVHEHLKDFTSWEMPEVQSLINDPRVHSIDGSDVSLESEGSRIESRVHEEADEMDHESQGNC